MKNLLIALCLIAIPLSGFSQKKSIKKFYKQYKKGKETRNFVIPGFLIRFATGLARDIVETDEEYEMLKLARNIRQARILLSEDFNPVLQSDFNDLVKGVKKVSYNDLIAVRAEGTNVNIMINENGEKIKGLLILISEEDTFMMLHLKTKLKYEDLNRLIEIFRDEIPIKIDEKKKEKEEVPVA